MAEAEILVELRYIKEKLDETCEEVRGHCNKVSALEARVTALETYVRIFKWLAGISGGGGAVAGTAYFFGG